MIAKEAITATVMFFPSLSTRSNDKRPLLFMFGKNDDRRNECRIPFISVGRLADCVKIDSNLVFGDGTFAR
jgi:hypothetical protein